MMWMWWIGSFLLIPIGIICLIIALVARKKSGNDENFPRIIRAIYMYKVMVVSLVMTITGFILTWNNAVNLIFSGAYDSAMRGLITSIVTIVIGIAMFLYHGKKIKKSVD